MQHLSAQEQAVGRHYDEVILQYEQERLPLHGGVEFGVTARYLRRSVQPGMTVAEVGVGGGYYSLLLAEQGCALYLADVAARLLQTAVDRLRAAGMADCIADSRQASATVLTHIADAACDAALFLGPFYHLCDPSDRQRAVQEAARVLKAGGLLFAAGINRLAYLRDTFARAGSTGGERIAVRARFLEDGNLDPEHAPPLGYAHLTTSEEFRALFAGHFQEIALVGVDSFASAYQGLLPTLDRVSAEMWLDLVEQTGRTPDGLGQSDHFLFIGRKSVQ
jgi:S-adenosylmethionine-dependent methyltransferase